MSSTEAPHFNPTELWLPGQELDKPIQQAVQEMNQKDPAQLISGLKKTVEHSDEGVVYAILKGDSPQDYSETDALVTFNPFANAATPNMLVRAEFIREVAKFSDVRDEDGKLKPVIMLASPGLFGSSIKLSRDEKQEVKSGELGPVARELLKTVSQKEVGSVALLGFSQGADMALAGARSAYSANLDTKSVAVGDPAGTEDRSRPKLARDFFAAGPKDLKHSFEATGLDAQKKAFGTGTLDFARFGLSGVRPLNLAIYKGLGVDSFESRIQEILDNPNVDKLVVAYGGGSSIAKPENIEPAMQRLYEQNGDDSFMSIKIEGAKHSWGDQLTLLAKLYMTAAV